MPFGSGTTTRVKIPSFRQNLIQDMEAVAVGRTGNNLNLLNQTVQLPLGVENLTQDGELIAMVGQSYVDGGNVVGKEEKISINGG